MNFNAIIEEGKFAQALREYVIVILDIAEYFLAREEVHFSAATFGLAGYSQRSNGNTHSELDLMNLSISADNEAQPFRQGVDYRHANAVQSPRYFVGIVIELAASMKFSHDNFSG